MIGKSEGLTYSGRRDVPLSTVERMTILNGGMSTKRADSTVPSPYMAFRGSSTDDDPWSFSTASERRGIHLREYWKLLVKYRRAVAASFFVSLVSVKEFLYEDAT